MKILLRKTVGLHLLTFEELSTVLADVKSTLNSRPLIALDFSSTDGCATLTPGHFLVGWPLKASPQIVDTKTSITLVKRWNLVKRLQTELWRKWSTTYLQQLQSRKRWIKTSRNFMIGDIVIVKDETLVRRTWPLARVVKVYPGKDGFVRVVYLLCQGKVYNRPIHRLVLLVPEDSTATQPRPLEDAQA